MEKCMIWLMLLTLAVVFVAGFRVLTSDSRRAVKRLSERLAIAPVMIESMMDQMGKAASAEFLTLLARPDETALQHGAQTLLIWQVFIIDGGDENLLGWHRVLQRARLASPLSDARIRLAFSLLREMEPEMEEMKAFQQRYNAFFRERSGQLRLVAANDTD
jgi:uncharacterized protein YneF (UPF0154 family)